MRHSLLRLSAASRLLYALAVTGFIWLMVAWAIFA